MAPSAPRTRAAAALCMKQIVLDNQSRMIRRLRAQLATTRLELDTIKEEHKANQIALEASHMTIAGLTEIGLSMSRKIEKMKAKKQKAKENHVPSHQKFQARIQEAEDSIQAQHLIIEALVERWLGLLQTIQACSWWKWKSSCCARERMTSRRIEEPVTGGIVLRLDEQLRVAILA
ncbi:hypothetical protein F511_16032 [Dorcoceras hygrometricum]|uniref:Uncharacterized protein n=1 Tax=Dorcoceras hygrometricum TaxID=472368 RepID=A0A2Z7C254_9LAMI|nr:hypothetical protein F511_16032 [Dorcoceras hygrometricum]